MHLIRKTEKNLKRNKWQGEIFYVNFVKKSKEKFLTQFFARFFDCQKVAKGNNEERRKKERKFSRKEVVLKVLLVLNKFHPKKTTAIWKKRKITVKYAAFSIHIYIREKFLSKIVVSEEDGKWLCSRKEKWWNFFLPPVLVRVSVYMADLISVWSFFSHWKFSSWQWTFNTQFSETLQYVFDFLRIYRVILVELNLILLQRYLNWRS